MQVQSLGQANPLAEENKTHSSILAWIILWREEPDRLHTMESQRVRQDLVTEHERILGETVTGQGSYTHCEKLGEMTNEFANPPRFDSGPL